MSSSFISSFPKNFTPSNSQTDIITKIDRAFNNGYKFVVCSAPTGSGKSFISKTIGNCAEEPSTEFREAVESYDIYKRNNFGKYVFEEDTITSRPSGCFALTITKSLQDQYKQLFNDIEILKGKSNYQCTYDDNFSVNCAPCIHIKNIKEKCWSGKTCTYYEARNKTILSKFSVLNYDMFFALPSHTKRKEYIVCDEAAELEDQLVKFFACQINFDALKKSKIVIPILPSTQDYGKIARWIQSMTAAVEDRIEELRDIVAGKNKPKILTVNSNIEELSTLQTLQGKLKTLISTWHESEYIIERHAKGINFTPLKVDELAKYIFDYADKVVLMSATIIDPSSFCKALGITKYQYIEAESTFDSSKGPIYISTKTKLNYSNLHQQLPKIANQITDICNHHSGEKGIIHTHTFDITNFLKKSIKNNRILYREPGISNEELLNIHNSSNEPTIIASPSMSHGVDLKGDLARFQIIIKAPYLPISDKRIEKLMKINFSWYVNKMLSSFIQACGRGIRSKEDHCVTYVLDGAIAEVVFKNKNKIPKYFLDRFV